MSFLPTTAKSYFRYFPATPLQTIATWVMANIALDIIHMSGGM
jgi:hypothetical protein